MLVLRRKCEESIVIDGDITVTVLGIEGDRVKIGVTAPPEVTIVRSELLLIAPTKMVPAPASTPLPAPAPIASRPARPRQRNAKP